MTVTSRMDLAITNLAALLSAREGLSEVTVVEEPVKRDELGKEYIIVAVEVELTQEPAALGAQARDERFTIRGVIEVFTPGATREDIRAGRQRCLAIKAEIEDEIRGPSGTTLDGAVKWCQWSGARYNPMATDQDRVASMSFDIDCFARLN